MQNPFFQLEHRRIQLGMTKSGVAKRSGVPLATVKRILAGREQRPAIASLQSIAAALGVAIRIGADSQTDPYEFRRQQAERKAHKLVKQVQATMALESQAVDSDSVQTMIAATVNELLTGPNRRLWDD